MSRNKEHWIVFGAQDKGDKSLLAYKDKKAGMYAVKILQNSSDCDYEIGEKADTGFAAIKNEIEGEYTTLLFSGKNGAKSIDTFIEILETVKSWMEKDAADRDHKDCSSCSNAGTPTCDSCTGENRYLKSKDCGWK